MRTSVLLSVTVLMLTALVICCSRAENRNAGSPTATPTRSAVPAVSATASSTTRPFASDPDKPPVSRVKSLPAEGGDKPTAGEVDGYRYSYKKDGEKTVATFAAKLLPADKDVVARAIRDVIYRSYGDRVDSDPLIVGTGPEQTIRIAGDKRQYVVVPVKESTGEIHSLIITQLN